MLIPAGKAADSFTRLTDWFFDPFSGWWRSMPKPFQDILRQYLRDSADKRRPEETWGVCEVQFLRFGKVCPEPGLSVSRNKLVKTPGM